MALKLRVAAGIDAPALGQDPRRRPDDLLLHRRHGQQRRHGRRHRRPVLDRPSSPPPTPTCRPSWPRPTTTCPRSGRPRSPSAARSSTRPTCATPRTRRTRRPCWPPGSPGPGRRVPRRARSRPTRSGSTPCPRSRSTPTRRSSRTARPSRTWPTRWPRWTTAGRSWARSCMLANFSLSSSRITDSQYGVMYKHMHGARWRRSNFQTATAAKIGSYTTVLGLGGQRRGQLGRAPDRLHLLAGRDAELVRHEDEGLTAGAVRPPDPGRAGSGRTGPPVPPGQAHLAGEALSHRHGSADRTPGCDLAAEDPARAAHRHRPADQPAALRRARPGPVLRPGRPDR